jgi:hypothetical protein
VTSSGENSVGKTVLEREMKEYDAESREDDSAPEYHSKVCICEPGSCAPPLKTKMTCYECEVCWRLIEDARRRSGLLR